jgi:aryl-alcohol dehydrogenase-like predicted oxidoreductase
MNKLSLGTVQFGLDYGVTNNDGQVKIEVVESILEYALQNNIDSLDTAPSYGNCEEILGCTGVDNFKIITKTIPLKDNIDEVIYNFHYSLNKLNADNVDGLLIHNIDDIKKNQFDNLYRKIIELKNNGFVNKIGFSCYEPSQIDFLLNHFDFDLIQVPINIFDNRLICGGQLQQLNANDIEVHARSVFLQGILLNFENLPGYFLPWERKFFEYQELVKASGLSLVEYALNYVLNIKEIDKVIVGVNSKEQLGDIINAASKELKIKVFEIEDLNLLNPTFWKI